MCFQSSPCHPIAIAPSLLRKREDESRKFLWVRRRTRLAVQGMTVLASLLEEERNRANVCPALPYSPCGSHGRKIESQGKSQHVWPHFHPRQWGNGLTSHAQISIGAALPGEEVVHHCPSQTEGLRLCGGFLASWEVEVSTCTQRDAEGSWPWWLSREGSAIAVEWSRDWWKQEKPEYGVKSVVRFHGRP